MSTNWTCQCCGRAIEARRGVIADHGYRRPGQGWQTPSCYGARAVPFELGHDALDRLIADLVGRWIPAKEAAKATHTTAPYPEKLLENVRTGAWTAPKLVDRVRPEGWNPTANSHDQYMPGTYGNAWITANSGPQLRRDIAAILRASFERILARPALAEAGQ